MAAAGVRSWKPCPLPRSHGFVAAVWRDLQLNLCSGRVVEDLRIELSFCCSRNSRITNFPILDLNLVGTLGFQPRVSYFQGKRGRADSPKSR